MVRRKKATFNLKAYKYYIIESIKKQKNIHFWDFDSEGEFGLTSQKINKLIRSSLSQGHKFPNNSLNEKTDHGKGIQKTFENLEINSDVNMLSDFSSLFALKSYNDFFNDSELKKIYVELAKKDRVINPDTKNSFSYILHIWHNTQIERAVLNFDFSDTNELKSVSINELFSFFSISKKMGAPSYPENIVKPPNSIVVNRLGNHYHLFDTSETAFSLILNTNNGKIIEKNYLFCTYSFIDSGIPMCGVGLLKKVLKSEVSGIMLSGIEPLIYNILFQRSNSLTNDEIIYSQNQGDNFVFKNDFFENGEIFTGMYQGFYLDDDFEEDKALRTLTMEILPSGEVKILDGEVGHEVKKGFCSITNEIIYITCDFKGDARIPRLIIVLDIPQAKSLEEKFELKGIYGGFSTSNKPYIGLIRFKLIKKQLNNNITNQKNYKLSEQQEAINKGYISTEILNFFKDEFFYRSPDKCIDKKLLDSLSNVQRDSKYAGPSGYFYLYSSSAAKKGIVRYPLLIKPNGEAKIKSITGTVESGYATIYFSNFLFINFHTEEAYVKHHSLNRPNKGFFIFYPTHKKNVKIVPGISLRINNDNKVQAKREFLISIDNKTSKQNILNKISCEALMPKDIRFKELPEKLRSTLLGREYNLIVVSDELENENKILQREKFSEIYFYYALFEYLRKMKNRQLAQREATDNSVSGFVKLAIEHGFINEQMFKTAFEEFSKAIKLDLRKKREIETYFSRIIIRELKDYYESPVG